MNAIKIRQSVSRKDEVCFVQARLGSDMFPGCRQAYLATLALVAFLQFLGAQVIGLALDRSLWLLQHFGSITMSWTIFDFIEVFLLMSFNIFFYYFSRKRKTVCIFYVNQFFLNKLILPLNLDFPLQFHHCLYFLWFLPLMGRRKIFFFFKFCHRTLIRSPRVQEVGHVEIIVKDVLDYASILFTIQRLELVSESETREIMAVANAVYQSMVLTPGLSLIQEYLLIQSWDDPTDQCRLSTNVYLISLAYQQAKTHWTARVERTMFCCYCCRISMISEETRSNTKELVHTRNIQIIVSSRWDGRERETALIEKMEKMDKGEGNQKAQKKRMNERTEQHDNRQNRRKRGGAGTKRQRYMSEDG
ncbi:hypothetical protein VP01_714g2 [Puccinia sorghi]|uniref:Uncharacterized protein n=1 Tax=Puccinia sorghi TaxID=27349 RepID=A0A0L6UDE0_9BASI|nr:hypothetical protein VP01_714g2 [Puccinia sorghi]